jgi:SecD/SecF fusion protein
MKNHFGRFLLVFLIAALSALASWKNPPPLGLDIKGGASLTYKARAGEGGELTPDRVRRAIEVIESRLNSTGVAEITITSTQQNEVVVELPGRRADQITDIKSLIERNGRLEFRIQAEPGEERKWREIDRDSEGQVQPPAELTWIRWKDDAQPKILVRTPEVPLKRELDKIERNLKAGSAEYQAALKRQTDADADPSVPRAEVNRLRVEAEALLLKLRADSPEYRSAQAKLDEVVRNEVFTGDQLVRTEIHHQVAQTVVFFEFKPERKPYFGAFTEKHVKEQMAIILDGRVNSAPNIESPLPGEGIIKGGGSGFKEKEARDLTIVLESGSTGINLTLSREESLGPSLGEVAIERGIWSVVVGLGLVVLTMIYYYRLPGMVANLALVLNLVILMGVLSFFRAALTLPGIAGVVLTLGMAVDANVLIFERYREERSRGKSLTESVAAGYDRAMSAIIDSNATTILTAVVLIILGTGSVKGFGVTLTVGLLASMFTSVYVTRWIFDWAIEKGIAKDLVLGGVGKPTAFDFMRKRRWFTLPSSVLMIVGVLGYLARDDYEKRDLEFVGGQEAIIQLASAITPHDAEQRAKAAADKTDKYAEASVVTLAADGVDAPAGSTNRFRVRAKAATPKEGEEFLDHLRSSFGDLLVSPPYTDVKVESQRGGGAKASMSVHTVGDAGDPGAWKVALAAAGFTDATVERDTSSPAVMKISVTDPLPAANAESVKARVGEATQKVKPKVSLSDPMPSQSFLEKSRAEQLYSSAVLAVIVSLAIEILYIRLRFADFSHGFAAVVAIVHDVSMTLGAVALADHFDIVYAKVNLVLIAAFLTLIGYSMNDNMVVFDRIREMLGKRRTVTSGMINDAINITLARSIRTSVTVFAVVLAQAIFSFGTGSSLEGFAFVMVIGVLTSMYSSIFIAAPLLLFLPYYLKKLAERPMVTALMVVATLAGAITMLKTTESTAALWIGGALAFNIPIHFLWFFFPWLTHEDPDSFVREELEAEQDTRPVEKPGI